MTFYVKVKLKESGGDASLFQAAILISFLSGLSILFYRFFLSQHTDENNKTFLYFETDCVLPVVH